MGSARSAPGRRTFLRYAGGVAAVLPLTALSGCGSSSVDDPDVIRIAYQQFGSGTLMEKYLRRTAAQYTKAHPERRVELLPIVAAENDYFTKNELLMSSARTSPDVAYEDTFILLSDVGAGYLQPIDSLVAGWSDWEKIVPASRKAVTGQDGKVYAVPTHTDTRALWFQRDVLAKAGLPGDWAPHSWDELLEAARTIKKKVPGTTPFFMFSGKAQGEKASMQGFEMLLYGTDSRLYDEKTKKWVTGSAGFRDCLEFIRTIFDEELTLPLARNLDPNISETIYTQLIPAGKLGILLDGSWISQNWTKDAAAPWKAWEKTMGLARMPTQKGQGSGWLTLSGGWSWGIPRHATDPKIAFSFIEMLCTKDNLIQRAIEDNHITIRSDVAEDERYRTYSPTAQFFTSILEHAYYRPALPVYPEVSAAIQDAMESVMTMNSTPAQAAADYDSAVTDIVGSENVTKEGA